jgi:hypothetical protein
MRRLPTQGSFLILETRGGSIGRLVQPFKTLGKLRAAIPRRYWTVESLVTLPLTYM